MQRWWWDFKCRDAAAIIGTGWAQDTIATAEGYVQSWYSATAAGSNMIDGCLIHNSPCCGKVVYWNIGNDASTRPFDAPLCKASACPGGVTSSTCSNRNYGSGAGIAGNSCRQVPEELIPAGPLQPFSL